MLNTNPDRTADRGRRTDDELNRKPEDSDRHHQESVPEPHTCPLTTIVRIHSKCQEANISSRIWFLSQLSSQGPGLGSLWIDYSEIFSLQHREIKVKGLKKKMRMFYSWGLVVDVLANNKAVATKCTAEIVNISTELKTALALQSRES